MAFVPNFEANLLGDALGICYSNGISSVLKRQ